MSNPWALAAPRASAYEIARLPRSKGLAICDSDDELWIQGPMLDDKLERSLRLIPGSRIFALRSDGQLVPRGKMVPRGRLPEGPWHRLADWLQKSLVLPEIQTAPAPDNVGEPVPLTVVPSGAPRDSTLLETRLADFAEYVQTAPQWRIDRWSFAVSDDGHVVVQGSPLPPLPGGQWTSEHGICVKAGFSWHPAVDAKTLRRLLQLQPDDVALLRPDGTWERIAGEHWVRCTRSAVRLTKEMVVR
jgi:hypothetical protein